MTVAVVNRTGRPLPAGVRAAARRGAARILGRRSADVTLVGDAEIRGLNRRWFGRRGPTDVIAFPCDEAFAGDVVISLDAARRQARGFRHPLSREVAILAAHGALHLLGEEDRTARGRRRMERMVEETLR